MPAHALPSGRYLSAAIDVSHEYGGQTRALLMRNRILAREAGVAPTLLTFGQAPDYPARNQALLEHRLTLPGIGLLNIYDHYREHDWSDPEPTGEELTDLRAHLTLEETHSDGLPWRATYRLPETGGVVHDFLRADGTPFLRIPGFVFRDAATWPHEIQRVSREGEVVGTFRSLGQWFRGWVRELTADDERVFLFMDTRYLVPHLVPMKAPKMHLVYVLHNIHVLPPRRWDSGTTEVYGRVLDRIPGMDALVTLTERQGQDIALRRGRTDNMFVVPNPVDMPQAPASPARDPRLATIVARLEPQKRLGHAVKAFARVLERVPDARLDIYGSGHRADNLAHLVRSEGVAHAVTLRGHDPHARDALFRSSAFLMTSGYEGYPLSTLESLSHGCPVVSYDIKYGPREQITDGQDGFLVPDGDVEAFADRVTELLTSPDLVERMSKEAVAKAEAHGTERFLGDWAHVLTTVVEQKPRRTELSSVDLRVHRLEVEPPKLLGRLARKDGGPALGRFSPDSVLRVDATLHVEVAGRRRDLGQAELSLSAVDLVSGEVVDLPVDVHRDGPDFRVAARLPLAEALGSGPGETRLRLRLTWRNSVWQGLLRRPDTGSEGVEVGYEHDGTLALRSPRRGEATGPDPR